MKKLSIILLCIGLLQGCANWSKSMRPGDNIDSRHAYLYGRFVIDTPEGFLSFLSFDGYQTIGLEFRCGDGSRYAVRFDKEPVVQLIKVKPSICWMSNIIFTDPDGRVVDKNENESGLFSKLILEPGKAYYLGDFFGFSNTTASYNSSRTTWKIQSMSNKFNTTSNDLLLKHKNLTSADLIDAISLGDKTSFK